MPEPIITPASIIALANGQAENFIAASTPGGIEAQEAAGQRDLVATFERLPVDMGPGGWDVARSLGFRQGLGIDSIFVAVTAPQGWRLSATEHSMHNDIIDPEGRVRGSIFYKAAFYDRRAHGRWLTRYAVDTDWGNRESSVTTEHVADRATGQRLWSAVAVQQGSEGYHALVDKDRAAAQSFLDREFPDHLDPLAYW